MILEAIEDHLRGSKAEEPVVRGKLTIEHVLPQGWTAHWPSPSAEGDEDPVERRNMLLHTIGNLTLLTQSLNSDASNAPWDTKRQKLADHSVLRLTAPLIARDDWDDESIRARSVELAGIVCDIWGRPTVIA